MDRREVRWTAAAVLLGVGLALGLALTLAPAHPPASCSGSPAGNTPLVVWLALSPPTETSRGPHSWYNSTIESAQGSIDFADLSLQIQTPYGGVVTPGATGSVAALGPGNALAAEYRWSGPTGSDWSSESVATVVSGEVLTFDAMGTNLSGDVWIALLHHGGPCPIAGSISVSIP